jgi:hypothetical protein
MLIFDAMLRFAQPFLTKPNCTINWSLNLQGLKTQSLKKNDPHFKKIFQNFSFLENAMEKQQNLPKKGAFGHKTPTVL